MAGSAKQFRFRKGVTIGALAAEEDSHFLKDCFIEVGAMNAILDMDDHRRIVLGRTGSGKSALFIHLSGKVQTITIHPDELALDHLSNSELLLQLHECGISLLPELLSKVVDGLFQAAACWGLIPSMNWVP